MWDEWDFLLNMTIIDEYKRNKYSHKYKEIIHEKLNLKST
jgi:hypothetical protein